MSAQVITGSEPLLADDDIQGDSLAGFRKDHTRYLFFRIGDVGSARRALHELSRRITPLSDVAAFNALFRSVRDRRGELAGTLTSAWLNIAFSADGLRALTSAAEVEQFDDEAFKQGMAARSSNLGDPTDPDLDGHPSRWLFGGPSTHVDAVVVAGADELAALDAMTATVLEVLCRSDAFELARTEYCQVHPDQRGREHFGFRDGISQPGVRGLLSSGAPLSPRYIEVSDPRSALFGRPGQALVWPGEFVLGLPRQAAPPEPPTAQAPARPTTPDWVANGSFLVIRRLTQDVAAFRDFLDTASADLTRRPGFEEMSPSRLAAALVGRWPSGAPLTRSAREDDAALGRDDFAANDFGYDTAWGDDEVDGPPRLRPAAVLPAHVARDDPYAPPTSDPLGLVCPHAAHVRKVNPRDRGTDIGGPGNTLRRRILRRGAPFGPAFDGLHSSAERGLLFACYQSSIVEQFEFLVTHWVNTFDKPHADPGGTDLLIGRSTSSVAILTSAAGAQARVDGVPSWVTPTGGGYFFAPSISALRDVLSDSTRSWA